MPDPMPDPMPDSPSDASQGDASQPSSQEVFVGKLITVRVETLPQPIGGTQRFEIVEHPDAVAILALRPGDEEAREPQVALVRQPRPAIHSETWELPAGLVKPDERDDPQRTAERELREETGYAARSWRRLIREYPSPGFSTEAITLYLATDLYDAGDKPDGGGKEGTDGQDEIDAVAWVPLSTALARAQAGEIADGKTLLGLTLASGLLGASASVMGGATMPRDVVNLPLGRMPTLGAGILPGGALDHVLKLDGMLLEEFNYAGNTAYQAMEDRARLFNLYLVIIGVLTSGLVAVYQLTVLKVLQAYTQPLTLLLLVVGGILGVVFFVQLIRLRQAHQDSIITMNMVKEYYLGRFQDDSPNIGQVFNWRLAGMKAGERLGSVTFLICFTVAVLAGLAFAAAAFVGYLLYSGSVGANILAPESYLPAGGIGLGVLAVAVVFQVLYYRVALSRKKEQAKIKQAQDNVAEAVRAAQAAQARVAAGGRG